jgi:hypothetical protein
VGLNLQDGGTGIFLSSDFGIGENMSLGLTANYLLSVNEDALGNIPDFGQRVDLKARFNANWECIEIRTQHGCLSGLKFRST